MKKVNLILIVIFVMLSFASFAQSTMTESDTDPCVGINDQSTFGDGSTDGTGIKKDATVVGS